MLPCRIRRRLQRPFAGNVWMITIYMSDGDPAPKRGDLVQTNVGYRRERTWLVIKARKIKRKTEIGSPRYHVWMARWWELETDLRLTLYPQRREERWTTRDFFQALCGETKEIF